MILFVMGRKSSDLSVVLCCDRVHTTTGSVRQYLKPSQITQIVQLFQEGASMCSLRKLCCVSQHSLICMVGPEDLQLYLESCEGLK